jgi:hypothetical protein
MQNDRDARNFGFKGCCFIQADEVHDVGKVLSLFFKWSRINQFIPVGFDLPPPG